MLDPNRDLLLLACLTFVPHLLMELRGARALVWARRSLAGHVALFGLSWAVPVSPVFLWLSYRRGTLTPMWGADIVAVCSMGGFAAGLLCWYLISLPYLKELRRWLISENGA